MLIDDERLAPLMIRNHVGFNPKQTFDVMRLDEDFLNINNSEFLKKLEDHCSTKNIITI